MQDVQYVFGFTIWSVLIPVIALIAYVGYRIKQQSPNLFKKFVAAVLILGVCVPLVIVVTLVLPPPTEIELGMDITYKSNSTSHEFSASYHWDASGVSRDAYGTHLQFIESYPDFTTSDTGQFAEDMTQWVQSMYVQWNEINVLNNGTWTLRLDFAYPVDYSLFFRGDNDSVENVWTVITDGRVWPSDLTNLESFGIEGLEMCANVSLSLTATAMRAILSSTNLSSNDISPIDYHQERIYMGTIPQAYP